jgi:hypothetical protein
MKKNTYTQDNMQRNEKFHQVTGDSRAARYLIA